MYIIGFILTLLAIGFLVDLRRGTFKSRKAHDTNPKTVHSPTAEHNAFNKTSEDRNIPF